MILKRIIAAVFLWSPVLADGHDVRDKAREIGTNVETLTFFGRCKIGNEVRWVKGKAGAVESRHVIETILPSIEARIAPPDLPVAAGFAGRFEFSNREKHIILTIRHVNSMIGIRVGQDQEEWFESGATVVESAVATLMESSLQKGSGWNVITAKRKDQLGEME